MTFDNVSPDIAGVLVAFVLGLFGFLGIIAKGVFDARSESRQSKENAGEATDEAKKANQSASQAEANTQNIGNGFANEVLERLKAIDDRAHRFEQVLTEHLNWHLTKEK